MKFKDKFIDETYEACENIKRSVDVVDQLAGGARVLGLSKMADRLEFEVANILEESVKRIHDAVGIETTRVLGA